VGSAVLSPTTINHPATVTSGVLSTTHYMPESVRDVLSQNECVLCLHSDNASRDLYHPSSFVMTTSLTFPHCIYCLQ